MAIKASPWKAVRASLLLPDSLTHNLEIAIDEMHYIFGRHFFAQAGIATNIGKEHGNLFGFAADILKAIGFLINC